MSKTGCNGAIRGVRKITMNIKQIKKELKKDRSPESN